MKHTPLTEIHEKTGAKLVEFAGYKMPLEYKGVIVEHMAVREKAGLFDVSHMGEFIAEGGNALQLIQEVTTNDVSKVAIGQAQYNCLPNHNGGIVDDLIIYRLGEFEYMLVVNASNIQKDWDWVNKHNKHGVALTNISDETALIALQGPKAGQILAGLTTAVLDDIQPFCFVKAHVAGCDDVLVSATGYTGAGGFELYCKADQAAKIWGQIVAEGEMHGLEQVGLAARDTLRLEKGYCLYGNDIDDTTSPIEAGLGWITKFNKGVNFPSKEIFERQKADGVKRKLTGIVMQDRGIPRHGYTLHDSEGNNIGEVTSGTQSPVLKNGIGMAYIQSEFAVPGNEVYLQVRNKLLKAKVTKFPFI